MNHTNIIIEKIHNSFIYKRLCYHFPGLAVGTTGPSLPNKNRTLKPPLHLQKFLINNYIIIKNTSYIIIKNRLFAIFFI